MMLLLSLCVAAPSLAQNTAVLRARTGYSPKDFTILRDGDWFHAFYIEMNTQDQLGTRLGHSRSPDLWHWEYLDSDFGPGSAAFDNQRVWAPHLVKVSGVYYLFYTGVSNAEDTPDHQSIGVATTTNLNDNPITWNRLSSPIMHCSIAPNTHCEEEAGAGGAGGQLRDPFAMEDPISGNWVTYYAAMDDGQDYMAVGIATPTLALDSPPWTDAGYVWTPDWTPPSHATLKVESPHAFSHDGLLYLVYTAFDSGLPFSVWTKPIDPEGDWEYRGRTGFGFASEKFDDVDGTEYFAVVTGAHPDRWIEIRKMAWTSGNWQFSLPNAPAGLTSISWNTATGANVVEAGQYANLVITSGVYQGRKAHLEIVEKDSGQPDQILALSFLNLTGPVTLSGTSTTHPWTSQFFEDDDATPNRLEIQVRVVGAPEVITPVLFINAPSGGGCPGCYEEGAGARKARDEQAANPPKPAVTLRVLDETPLGPGIGLLVDLAEATEARLELFDIAGRRLRTMSNGVLPKGATVLLWDGRDDVGRTVPAGVVFARLSTPKEVRTVRLMR